MSRNSKNRTGSKTALPTYSQAELFIESNESVKSDCKQAATQAMKSPQPGTSRDTTVSIQNIQFPDISSNSPGVFNVKRESNLLKFPKTKSNQPAVKARSYDFTSSTNSQYDQKLSREPKKIPAKYSASTDAKPDNSQTSPTLKSSQDKFQPDKNTSQEMIDSHHDGSEKRMNFHGSEWKRPCKESFVAGAPRKFVGTCTPNYEQISKWSKTRQKFFLTQDPRKVHCLVNPEVLRSKEFSQEKVFNALTKMVEQGQNICAASASESSEDFICEVIDLENPLQLDFQGLDYSNTYQKDEQDLQNQRYYRRVGRYMDRRQVKTKTQQEVEEAVHHEMRIIPKRFDVRDRHIPPPPVSPEPQIKLGKLYRSEDKPNNKKIISSEEQQRRERYKDLYLKYKQRQEEKKKSQEINDKQALENLSLTLADANLEKIVKEVDESIEKSAGKEMNLKQPESKRRTFPHTMLETKCFMNDMKQKKLLARTKARIAKEFFWERKGKLKEFPEADLDISSPTSNESGKCSNISELSTDDADDLEVGKQGSKFKLRGFQFKMGSNLRGKLTQREKLKGTRKEKGCITRDQWLEEMAPKKQQIKLDVEKGIQKLRSPDDAQLALFAPTFGFKVPKIEHSTIRNYITKPLGRHYDRVRRKKLKFAKPQLRHSVKKFNLISYRFGDTAKRFSQVQDPLLDAQILKLKTTPEFMMAKALQRKQRQEELKQKRLKLLGIPCKPVKKSRLQIKCENSSSSSDSDWVPQQEPLGEEDQETNKRFKEIEKVLRPLNMRCNMPAPKYREPTLRQHPRRPRDYDNLRVPSDMFDQIVLTANLPFMQKLDRDIIKFANVELERRPYTDKFEARHHHDHWDPTQVQQVRVSYNPHLVKPEKTNVTKKSQEEVMENFRTANLPCNQFVDMDLSLPQLDFKELIEDHYTKTSKTQTKKSGVRTIKNLCTQKDLKLQSRDPKELVAIDYPGRQEYLQLLKDVRVLYEQSKQMDESNEKSLVNKAELLKELQEDLKSIESCLTSLSSSVCTNLTNDSGSFLLMEGKEKIPLDYIRKSVVPFEELQRSRFRAVPIDVDKEQANPFQVLPFSGQNKAQLELTTAKDSFFTFNTRLNNGMRLRLEVPVEDVREKLLGMGTNKHKAVVATDIDENYVEVLKNRPAIKPFKFKTSPPFIKDALRLKFVSMLIQGQIVRTEIYDHLNEQHWQDMLKTKELFEDLFAKWQKREYDASMAVVYKVKSFYDETDRLKTEFKQLERELAMLNMDIVFIEAHWVLCIMLQNFHYLLGDQEWRLQHDWIHRLDDSVENQLENFADSIAKRSTLNIRKRGKDDAWAIKTYYEEVYLENKRDNLVVFDSAESFLKGLENLKTKTFIILLEMHMTLAIHTELQDKLESFEDWCGQDLREKEQYVKKKCAKLYFMEDRAKWLSERTLHFLGDPIEECFSDETFHKDRAVIAEAWRRIVPLNLRVSASGHDLYTVDMVSTIFEVLMDILAKFETIPMDLTQRVENELRAYRAYLRKQSYEAYHTERRIDMEMKKVVKNLEKPYRKRKRTSKLPRYYLKKREKPVQIKEKIISERAKFFFRAFHEGEFPMESGDIKDSIIQVDGVQEQIVPFYFDHFLKINGYTPNYNLKTQIEIRDGLEMDRLQIKSVIPEIQQRMEYWENMKRKIMDDNIAQNPKMYVNVMT